VAPQAPTALDGPGWTQGAVGAGNFRTAPKLTVERLSPACIRLTQACCLLAQQIQLRVYKSRLYSKRFFKALCLAQSFDHLLESVDVFDTLVLQLLTKFCAPEGNEETDFFKNSKYASSAKCACSKVCFTPALNFG
jgi:hypothetical protein